MFCKQAHHIQVLGQVQYSVSVYVSMCPEINLCLDRKQLSFILLQYGNQASCSLRFGCTSSSLSFALWHIRPPQFAYSYANILIINQPFEFRSLVREIPPGYRLSVMNRSNHYE